MNSALPSLGRSQTTDRLGGSPPPAVIEALVERCASTSSDDNKRPDRASPEQALKAPLPTDEAADFLRLSRRALDGYRVMGTGPAYHVFGNRVVYSRADLLTWAWTKRRGLHHKAF